MNNAPRLNRRKPTMSPCYQCPDRTITCHCECQKYMDFKQRVRDEYEKMAKAYEGEYLADEVKGRSMWRNAKVRHLRKK